MRLLRRAAAAVVGIAAAAILSPLPTAAAEPLERQTTGSGSIRFAPATEPGYDNVVFDCVVRAGPDAVATHIRPPYQGGCLLYKGDTLIAAAGGIGLLLPAATTGAAATVDQSIPGPYMVCWSVGGMFIDGTYQPDTGCT